MTGTVVAVAKAKGHRFSKNLALEILLLKGLGVAGDAHQGSTVKHRSGVAADPMQPNLRQVHLIHLELFKELADQGFGIQPADLGRISQPRTLTSSLSRREPFCVSVLMCSWS
ncbi:hypothetical protein LZ686_16885 [Paracoccus sp. NFXS7]|uniref:hypothetical protein n=1 Tax=Paracoccus sp. NFXS7 TaxID=2908653 RepID=UPI0032DF3930